MNNSCYNLLLISHNPFHIDGELMDIVKNVSTWLCIMCVVFSTTTTNILHLHTRKSLILSSSCFFFFLHLAESRSHLNFSTFKRPILQSRFLIGVFIPNQDLRKANIFNSPSSHLTAITAFVISCLLLQTPLIGCCISLDHAAATAAADEVTQD